MNIEVLKKACEIQRRGIMISGGAVAGGLFVTLVRAPHNFELVFLGVLTWWCSFSLLLVTQEYDRIMQHYKK